MVGGEQHRGLWVLKWPHLHWAALTQVQVCTLLRLQELCPRVSVSSGRFNRCRSPTLPDPEKFQELRKKGADGPCPAPLSSSVSWVRPTVFGRVCTVHARKHDLGPAFKTEEAK